MTSTSICTGMDNIEKPTSRVLAPPGGKTNFSLGGYGEEPAPAAQKPTNAEPSKPQPQPQAQAQQDLYKPSPPQPIRPAVGHNPVTGEPSIGATQEREGGATRGQRGKPEKLDPASMPAAGGRVETRAPIKRQPPGGKDSGIFS